MIYDPEQPIDAIFNSIDDLMEYERASEAELIHKQKTNLALVILNKQRIFKDDIRAWNVQTTHTRRGSTSSMTSAKLTLNS